MLAWLEVKADNVLILFFFLEGDEHRTVYFVKVSQNYFYHFWVIFKNDAKLAYKVVIVEYVQYD